MTSPEAIEIVGKVITPVRALAVTVIVFFYTRRRDRLNQIAFFNSQSQEIAKTALSDDVNPDCTYSMLFPKDAEESLQNKKRVFLVFMILNITESIWRAKNCGLVESAYADRDIDFTIEACSSDLSHLDKCLRFYSDDFQGFVRSKLAGADR